MTHGSYCISIGCSLGVFALSNRIIRIWSTCSEVSPSLYPRHQSRLSRANVLRWASKPDRIPLKEMYLVVVGRHMWRPLWHCGGSSGVTVTTYLCHCDNVVCTGCVQCHTSRVPLKSARCRTVIRRIIHDLGVYKQCHSIRSCKFYILSLDKYL